MSFIHAIGFMGTAVIKMNTEMSGELVVFDCGRAMRHAVHGSGIYVPVIFHKDGAPCPRPVAAKHSLDRLGVL